MDTKRQMGEFAEANGWSNMNNEMKQFPTMNQSRAVERIWGQGQCRNADKSDAGQIYI